MIKAAAPPLEFFAEDVDDRGLMIEAIERQERWFRYKLQLDTTGEKSLTWHFAERQVGIAEMLDTLTTFKEIYSQELDSHRLRAELVRSFDFYKVGGTQKQNILFTGYYTPILQASRVKTAEYQYPLYRLPPNLIEVDLSLFSPTLAGKAIWGRFDEVRNKFLPYFSREEIDWQAKLAGTGLEIAFLKDYIDQFFLHIQGGGILELTDGTRININYAGKNGRPFVGVGKLLIQNGEIMQDQMSMHAIKEYFQGHPEKIKTYCTQNESYVFYEEAASGPYGSLGIIVTPERTIAMDKKLFPGGELCLIQARIPVPEHDLDQPPPQKICSRFVLDQDTGGAIIGKHVDLYCGAGERAAIQAGSLNSMGDVYFLLKKH
ncbi:MltA domain-containing protein [bacterium]|nr:MltA domain-containing protein [bacterium]